MKPTRALTLCITGGHLSPALAVAAECSASHPEITVVFIGRTFAFEKSGKSVEEEAMKPFCKRTYAIDAARLTIGALPALLRAIVAARAILTTERPDVVLSFGGYVAVPIVIAAWLLHIPVVTHEQTHVVGKANRLITRFAKKVAVSFPEMVKDIPGNKGIYTGFPLRSVIFSHPEMALFHLDPKYPCLFITGGTTGAASVNELIFPVLQELLNHFTVIHQTGDPSYDAAAEAFTLLSKNVNSRYVFRPYFSGPDVAWILSHAKLVVGRAGANTVWELAAKGVPSVLVPLPWSADAEQQKNAEWLATHGAAVVLDQTTLTSESLKQAIFAADHDYSSLSSRAKKFAGEVPKNGTQVLLSEVIATIS